MFKDHIATEVGKHPHNNQLTVSYTKIIWINDRCHLRMCYTACLCRSHGPNTYMTYTIFNVLCKVSCDCLY